MAIKHVGAQVGEIAESVVMPGDPLRARYIAENYLEGARLVTEVRNMLGFTGTYRGLPLSVMSHGIGIPSISLYVSELLTHYGVRRIVRAGSCGTVQANGKLRDIVIAMGACTDSGVNRMRFGGYDYAPIASYELLEAAVRCARESGLDVRVGNVFSADLFYTPDVAMFDTMEKYGILGVEMETAGLYALAAEHRAEALAICTVSDQIRTGEALSTDERERSFDAMIRLVLDTLAARVTAA